MLHIEQFLETLPYMFKGMFGIFIVTGIIIAVTMILNRVTEEKEED